MKLHVKKVKAILLKKDQTKNQTRFKSIEFRQSPMRIYGKLQF